MTGQIKGFLALGETCSCFQVLIELSKIIIGGLGSCSIKAVQNLGYLTGFAVNKCECGQAQWQSAIFITVCV